MDIERASGVLFGRYQALKVYAAIARLPKPEFTTGQVATVTGIPPPQCSKELTRLADLSLVRATSRRGDYHREPSSFWALVDVLAVEWGLPL